MEWSGVIKFYITVKIFYLYGGGHFRIVDQIRVLRKKPTDFQQANWKTSSHWDLSQAGLEPRDRKWEALICKHNALNISSTQSPRPLIYEWKVASNLPIRLLTYNNHGNRVCIVSSKIFEFVPDMTILLLIWNLRRHIAVSLLQSKDELLHYNIVICFYKH